MLEESRTNSIRNNTMVGAAAGTPGTLPTNWSSGFGNGISRQIVGTGTQNGISYIDVNYSGTATAATAAVIFFEAAGASGIAATSNQAWTESAYLAVVSGSLSGANSAWFGWYNYNGATYLGSQQTSNVYSSLNETLTRYATTALPNNTSTTNVEPYLFLSIPNGNTINVTIRIGMPQLEQGWFATSPMQHPAALSHAQRKASQGSHAQAAAPLHISTLLAHFRSPMPTRRARITIRQPMSPKDCWSKKAAPTVLPTVRQYEQHLIAVTRSVR